MKRQLLICEDEPSIRTMLQIMFQLEGIDADLASNGKEALILLGKHDYKAISLDLKMPIMSGVELLHVLDKELHKRVVVFSCYVDDALKEYPQVKFVLNKPEDMQEYIKVIKDLVNAA